MYFILWIRRKVRGRKQVENDEEIAALLDEDEEDDPQPGVASVGRIVLLAVSGVMIFFFFTWCGYQLAR